MPQRRPARTRSLEQFGKRVRRRRQELGLSQDGLADAARLHRTYVSSLERGYRNVALLNILKIATALRVDPGDLVHGLRS